MLVVHEEGNDEGKPYYTVFYQQTRDIALRLQPEDPITVVGFPLPTTEEGKHDTLRVVRMVHYPGKPTPPRGKRQ